MTIKYMMTLKADIVFDGDFTYSGMNDKYHSLDELMDTARSYMGEYNFMTATIVDTETGEVIVEMERDWQDDCDDNDDGPAYYDDGDSCGYE